MTNTKNTTLGIVKSYLTETKWHRKLLDALLICVIILMWGVANGNVNISKLYNPFDHTVESTLIQSSAIQKIIDGEQYKNDFRFIGSFKFHNGTVSLDGYNFMKYSLTEYSTQIGTMVDTPKLQNVPIVMNNRMIRTLAEGVCYSDVPDPNNSLYSTFELMEITQYISCPIYSTKDHLAGFIMIGVRGTELPSVIETSNIASRIRIFKK